MVIQTLSTCLIKPNCYLREYLISYTCVVRRVFGKFIIDWNVLLHCLLLFIVLAVPSQPQKVKKPEEDSTSGEENSEDDDLVADNSAPLEDEVPTKVCLCLIYGSSLLENF